jgi:hypothetical protein
MWPPTAHIRLEGEVKEPDENCRHEGKLHPDLQQAQLFIKSVVVSAENP